MSTGETDNKIKAIHLAESMGEGWTVYRIYGTRMYRICRTSLEYMRGDIADVVHRTFPADKLPPAVINRGQWNEREEDKS